MPYVNKWVEATVDTIVTRREKPKSEIVASTYQGRDPNNLTKAQAYERLIVGQRNAERDLVKREFYVGYSK